MSCHSSTLTADPTAHCHPPALQSQCSHPSAQEPCGPRDWGHVPGASAAQTSSTFALGPSDSCHVRAAGHMVMVPATDQAVQTGPTLPRSCHLGTPVLGPLTAGKGGFYSKPGDCMDAVIQLPAQGPRAWGAGWGRGLGPRAEHSGDTCK